MWVVRQTFHGSLLGTPTHSGYAENPVQIGEKQLWKAFTDYGLIGDVLAISTDNRLWRSREGWHSSRRVRQASRHTDWIAVGRYRGCYVGLAADGTLTFWDAFEGTEAMIPSRRSLFSINIFDEPE